MVTVAPPSATLAEQRDAFLDRLLEAAAGTFNTFALYIGDQLGLYRALAEGGAQTAGQLAASTRTNERYIREWLEQQTVAGIVEVENPQAEASARRFRLPEAHVEVLVDEESLN